MIELSILDLLYLVLTFFIVIVGTLLTLVLLRVLKILEVAVELTHYYHKIKQLMVYYSYVPFALKDRIFAYFRDEQISEEEVKDPII